jgi:hypothetical protein
MPNLVPEVDTPNTYSRPETSGPLLVYVIFKRDVLNQ